MPRFRKKQIEVEAVQHAPGVQFPLSFLRADEAVRKRAGRTSLEVFRDPAKITLAIVKLGDWLVRQPSGSLTTCNGAWFEATYEPVDRSEQPATSPAGWCLEQAYREDEAAQEALAKGERAEAAEYRAAAAAYRMAAEHLRQPPTSDPSVDVEEEGS